MASAPTAFQRLGQYSYAGIKFPVERCVIKGGLRDHVHEYPHADGGAAEKLGRKLYTFTIATKPLDEMVGYVGLFPQGMNTLRALWEAGYTKDLYIPSIGTISAYAFDWTETLDAKCMNGESLELQLREDQQFMLDSAIDVRGTGLYAAMNEMSAWMQVLPDAPKLKDLFDSLQEGVNLVTSVADQVELVGNQIEAKIARVESICNQMDSALGILSKPVNMRLLDALHSTWEAAVKLHKDILQTGASPLKYTTGAAMTIAQVAQAMYGDTARAMDIMKMNAIEDPFRIPRGTMLLGPGLSRTA